jgi:hypothetical protein
MIFHLYVIYSEELFHRDALSSLYDIPEELFQRDDLSSLYDIPREAFYRDDLSSLYDIPIEMIYHLFLSSSFNRTCCLNTPNTNGNIDILSLIKRAKDIAFSLIYWLLLLLSLTIFFFLSLIIFFFFSIILFPFLLR